MLPCVVGFLICITSLGYLKMIYVLYLNFQSNSNYVSQIEKLILKIIQMIDSKQMQYPKTRTREQQFLNHTAFHSDAYLRDLFVIIFGLLCIFGFFHLFSARTGTTRGVRHYKFSIRHFVRNLVRDGLYHDT